MIAVIFEVVPREGRQQAYLDAAAALRPELERIDGFVSVERFQSLTTPGKLLSLSFWRDEEAVARWPLLAVTVIHRGGRIKPGERIVLVAVSSSHREAAFSACDYVMDFLKTRAPFWKKESTPAGERWVEARTSDDEAAGRWKG